VAIALKSVGKRQLKNSLAKWLITLGGISVLFTLVLIFMYLLYVIKPIFDSAEVKGVSRFEIKNNAKTLATGLDELQELAFIINERGIIDYYHLVSDNAESIGSAAFSKRLTQSDTKLTQVIKGDFDRKLLLDELGNVQLIETKFHSDFSTGQRRVIPDINYPLTSNYLPIDPLNTPFKYLSFSMDNERAVFVGLTQDDRLIKTSLIAEDDFSDDPGYEAYHQEFGLMPGRIDDIKVSPDMAFAFILSGDEVFVFDLIDEESIELKSKITPKQNSEAGSHITSMALLSGGSSILLGDNNGQVSQWFEVLGDKGREFKQIRTFAVSETEAVVEIHTEQFRKSFYTFTSSGEMGLFYTTSEADLWRGKLSSTLPTDMVISPRADGLLLLQQEQNKSLFQLYSVVNEHPEVTWQALWQEVWYEGYPEPQFIWQSTSGTDDFEGKFSLVPISFGTIKAAMYAMLFAVPIALSSAIYTAYFMTPGLRKKVKPTIELMEALPTVILGFLAGLWLAPIIEDYLPAIVLLMVLLPTSIFITAFIWHNLSRKVKEKIPETLAPLLLIPALLMAAYCSFSLSPWVETVLFGGDVRQYITNNLGIDFDQRNALVVGIAMGFAVIPTIFSMAEDAIFSVPKHLTSGSLALGATQWQTLIKVVLLTASPGIFSAVMMGLGRAVGETMIVLMATGNTPILDWSIFQGMRTLAANIAVEMPESEVGSSHYRILFLAAFVLFVFTFIFNTAAEFIRQRLRDKYSSL